MSDTCKSCGEQHTRIDAPIVMSGGGTVADSYCGACGANWGVFVPRIAEDSRHERVRKQAARFLRGWKA